MNIPFNKLLLASFIVMLSISYSNTYAQCAMCKAVTTSNNDSGKNKVGKGINNGILYLLVTPYLLVGAGAFYVYKNRRKD